jgi:hypothetical protein
MPRYAARTVALPGKTRAPAAAAPQRRPNPPERPPHWHALQLRAALSARAEAVPATPSRDGLPAGLKGGIEQLSGIAMDDVRVHRNSSEPAKLGALAYAKGSDIHLAPGQERHLPHEAWHVVQQKQGRVQATRQLRAAIAVNENAGLEAEADRMGEMAARSMTARRGSPQAELWQVPAGRAGAVQRKTAASANLVAGYVGNGEQPLYNIAPAVTLADGIIYEKAAGPVFGTQEALDAYIDATRPVGAAARAHKFLDFNKDAATLPGQKAWNDPDLDKRRAARATYADSLANQLGIAADPIKLLNYLQLGQLWNRWARNQREDLRNRDDVAFIDPFITKLTIARAGQNGSWVFETNFSEAALGYVTRITVPSAGVTGRITTSPVTFTQVENAVSGANAAYSPSHDTTTNADVGTQIAAISSQASNKLNHPGLDAVAKWGAEGARFEPVRQLGPALKVDSRFYCLRDHDRATVYLTFQQLYANWGDWFGRAYGIAAGAVRAEVLNHPTNLGGAVDLAHDYDLDKARPASARTGALPGEIQAIRDRITEITREKAAFAAGQNSQRAIRENNERQNALIRDVQDELAAYQRMYPTLYRPPAPPPQPALPAPVVAAAQGNNPQADQPGYLKTIVVGAFALLSVYFLSQALKPSSS